MRTAPRRAARPPDADVAAKRRAAENYGQLPMGFEPNRGQTDAQVKFLARGSGYSLFLKPTEAILALHQISANGRSIEDGLEGSTPRPLPGANRETVVQMKLAGARETAEITGLGELPGRSNYFLGKDPKKWRTNIPTFAQVRYREVYPGIDLLYYGNQRHLEYDFIVAPGANPRAIALTIAGPETLEITAAGDLVLHVPGGHIRLHKPAIYQEANGQRQQVAGGFVLRSKKEVGFRVGKYDRQRPLIIDPVLSYSTYLGGSGAEDLLNGLIAGGIAVDSGGNAYVAGTTASVNFPTVAGSRDLTCGSDGTCNGSTDVFVAKLNSSGSALIYSTYLGGNSDDTLAPAGLAGIVVDSTGAYLTGSTTSTDFPTTAGAFKTTCGTDGTCNGGFEDVFVTKLDPTGANLVFSTYLGGSSTDESADLEIDSSGNVYVTGVTSSDPPGFPITGGAFQAARGSSNFDGFVGKLSSTGTTLLYLTYLGGLNFDAPFRLTVDSTGNAYVVGLTSSANYPTTPGSFQTMATSGGVFKTTNGGANWGAINTNITDLFVPSLAIDPSTPQTVYAGTQQRGVFKSTDGGTTWTQLANANIINRNVRALAMVSSTTIYAGTSAGVRQSLDSGNTWAVAVAGNVFALAIDPASPTTVYSGTTAGVLKTINGGTSWTLMTNGLFVTDVRALAIDPSNSQILYAGTNGGGVFKSTNGGANWLQTNFGLNNQIVLALAVDPSNTQRVFAGTSGGGVFKSTDGGSTWVSSPGTNPFVRVFAFDPTTPSTIYAGTNGGGIFKSTNSGGTWSPTNTGLSLGVRALAIPPSAPATIYAGVALQDAFVTKVNPTGTGLSYSTLLAGNAFEDARGIVVDSSGDTYVAGATNSTDFPTTAGVVQQTLGGLFDGYVLKLNSTGTGLTYSTLLGGNQNDFANDIAVDVSGNAWTAGSTASQNFPIANAFRVALDTEQQCGTDFCPDAFVAKLNPVASSLLFSTYLGGRGDDEALGVALDPSGNAYVTGFTQSVDFPLVAPLQPSLAGGAGDTDAFVLKISDTAAFADLSLTASHTPEPVSSTGTVTINIMVTNNGPDVATGVIIAGTVAAGTVDFTDVSLTPSQGSCASGPCNLGTLAVGASATLTFVGRPLGVGVSSILLSTGGNESDPTPANNSKTETITIEAGPAAMITSPPVSDQTGAINPAAFFGVPSSVVVNQNRNIAFVSGNGTGLFRRVTGPATLVLQAGDPVPGIAGSRITSVNSAQINSSATVATLLVYATSTGVAQQAIVVFDGSAYRLVASSDQAAAGTVGVYGSLALVGITNAGDVAFTGSLVPVGGTGAAQTTMFFAPGTLAPILRIAGPGDSVSGLTGTIGAINLTGGVNNPASAPSEVNFAAPVTGGSGGFVLLVGSVAGGVRKVVANGDPFPAPLVGSFSLPSLNGTGALNNSRQVAFTSNGSLWVHSPVTGITQAVAANAAAPAPVTGTLNSFSFVGGSFSDAGDIAFRANVAAGNTTAGVFRFHAGTGLEAVAFAGQAAPGTTAQTFLDFGAVTMNNSRDVSFYADLAGGPILIGLFQQTGAGLTLNRLALEGDSAPLAGGGTFGFGGLIATRTLNDGSTVFFGDVLGSGADFGIFLATAPGTSQSLMSTEDALPGGTRVSLRTTRVGANGNFVVFLSRRSGGQESLWVQNVLTGAVSRVVGDRDPAPGTGGGRIRLAPTFSSFPAGFYRVNTKGTVSFMGAVIGGTAYPGNAIYLGNPMGQLTKIVAEKDVDPGSGGTFTNLFGGATALPVALNDASQVVFTTNLTGAFTGSGIFLGSAFDPVRQIALTGDFAPSGGTFTAFGFRPAINQKGEIAFFGTTSVGTTSLFEDSGATGLVKIVGAGDASPTGGTFPSFPINASVSLNDRGEVAFGTSLTGGPGGAVFIGSAAPSLFAPAVNGNPAPSGGTFSITSASLALTNDQGDLLFQSNLTGGTSNSGLFLLMGETGNLQAVAVQGQAAPGTAGSFVAFPATTVIDTANFTLGPSGEVAFSNGIDTAGTLTSGLFRYRTDNTLEKIIARGDTAPNSGGGVLVTDTPPAASSVAGRFAFWAGIRGGSISDAIYVTDAVASADLALMGTGLPDPVAVGQVVTYVLVVTNNGTIPATGVRLVGTKESTADLNLISVSGSQGTCAVENSLFCDFGALLPGGSANVVLQLSPVVAMPIVLSAVVSGNEADPNPANDTATLTTTVTAATACTINFDNSAGTGLWQTATNWSTDTLPGPTDNACIGAAFNVTLSAGTQSVNSLNSDGPLTVSGGSLSLAAASQVNNNFTLSGGTLTGAGDLFIGGGTFTWSGGDMGGGGSITIPATVTTVINSNAFRQLLGRTINNAGTITWMDAGLIRADAGTNAINNLLGATFNAQNNSTLGQAFSGTLAFNNQAGASFIKSGAGTTTTIGGMFNNTGTTNAQSGTLSLEGGGSSNGIFTTASGATLAFGGGTNSLTNISSVSGAGTVAFTGGTTSIAGSYNISGSTNISGGTAGFDASASSVNTNLSGGTLGGTGTLTTTGSFNWTAGSMGGGGTTSIPVGATMTISTDTFRQLLGRTINNAGTITWIDAGQVRADVGTNVINNLSGGNFNAQNNSALNQAFSGTAVFNNQAEAVFTKSVAGTTTTFGVPFNNDSTVNIQSGTLSLSGGGTSTGSFTMAAGAILQFPASYAFNNGTFFTGAGVVRFTGGTAGVNGDVNAVNVDLAGGILGGTGTLTATGTFNWTSGSMGGDGVLSIPTGAMLAISTGTFRQLLGHTINNAGTATWIDAALIRADSGTNIINNLSGAVFNAQNDSILGQAFSGTLAFNNQAGASFIKSGVGTTTGIGGMFNNAGTTDVQSGMLSLSGGGTSGGVFTVAGRLTFSGGTHTLTNTSSVTGAGSVETTAGTATFAGTYNVSGSTDINGGTAAFDASATSVNTNLSSGSLAGTSTLTTTGAFNWTAGSMSGGGTTALAASATLTISSNTFRQLLGRTINLAGTTFWQDVGLVRADSGTNIINNLSGATFNAQNNSALDQAFSGTLTFNNQSGASLIKSGAGTITTIGGAFNNDGSVDAQSGTLSLSGGGTTNGAFTVAAGATLAFSGGTHTLAAGSSVTGAGAVTFSSGTVNLGGTYNVTGSTNVSGATTNFNIASTTASLNLSSGTLSGSATLTASGVSTWTAGSMDGDGVLSIPAGGTLTISSNAFRQLLGHTINNAGTITWMDAGLIRADGGTNIINNLSGATFNAQNDSSLGQAFSGTLAFNNQAGATLVKSVAGTATVFSVPFTNSGSVDIQSGTLRLGAGSTDTGPFTVASGGVLNFLAGTHTVSGSITGAGAVIFDGGTVDLSGPYGVNGTTVSGATANFLAGSTITSVGPLTISSGTANFSSNELITVPSLTLSGGALSGTDAMELAGPASWTGGSIGGGGTTTVLAGQTLTINTNAFRQLLGRTINNAGTITWMDAGQIRADAATNVITNQSGATFNAQNNSPLGQALTGTLVFNNQVGASFIKSGAGTTSTVSVLFNADGPVDIQSGTLSLGGGGVSTGPFTVASGAVLNFLAGNHTVSGSITGAGAVIFDGGTADLSGPYSVNGTTVSGATANFLAASTVTGVGPLTISSGTANFSSNELISVPSLTLSAGALSGTDTVQVTGPAGWAGGSMGGGGITELAASATLTISSNAFRQLLGRTINNAGTITWMDAGQVRADQGSNVINNLNGATFSAQNNSPLGQALTGTLVFNNQAGAQFTKSTAATTTTFSGASFTNAGAVQALSGTLSFTSPFTQVAGNTNLLGGAISTSTSLNIQGGILGGTGTITGNVSNGGQVEPGFSPGTLNITGSYTQTASGILNIEMSGVTAGTQYDVLAITGSAMLNGTLNVSQLSGFTPASGNSFQILTYASVTGDFATKNGLVIGGVVLQPFVNATNYTLTAGTAADLALTKAGAPSPVNLGANLTYTITVTNNGPSTATGVTVTDSLPGTVTFVSATPTQGSCAGTTTVLCTLGTLANGANATITIVVTPTGGGTLSNTASVTANEADPNTANNSATAMTPVIADADVSVTKSDAPDPALVGASLTYAINVTNNGPAPATGITLTDPLPPGVTFVSATPAQGTCTGTTTVTCNLGTLANGASTGVSIVVTPTTAGLVSNTASVTANETDPVPANNSSTTSTTVNSAADLSITKLAAPEPVLINSSLTYTILVNNAGPSPATGVVVTDTLPAGAAFGSALPSQGTCTGTTTVTCTLGTIASGTGANVVIVIVPTAAGTIVNNATVSANEADPNAANNTASVTTTVNPAADLAVAKVGSPDPVSAGNALTYTVSVINNGPNTATSVTLTDALPAGAAFVSATPSQGTCSGTTTVSCSLGSLARTATATVTIVVTPTLGGTTNNTASVSAAEGDPIPGNNSATASTQVIASADLSISKTDTPDPAPAGSNLTYTIVVTNSGPSPATGVVVTDPLPATTSFVLATATQGTCTLGPTGTLSCNLGSLARGATATVTLVVTPSTIGTISNTASVSANENDPNLANNSFTQPTTVSVGPAVTLSTTNVNFPNQPLNSTSAPISVTLTNSGNATLSIASIVVTGDFAQTNACGASLAAGANCVISVTFTPTAAGARNGTLSITDNAPGSPHVVTLTGMGITAPAISLSSTSLLFSSRLVGTTSPSQMVTLTNIGNATLNITSIVASGDFAQTNTCGTTVAVGANCTISVTFTPTAAGIRTGGVTINSNAPGSMPVITLTGSGTSPGVTLSTTLLIFAGQAVGTTSAAQTVTLTNGSASTLTITTIAASGDFAQTNTCGASVAVSATCTISVTFTPTAAGTRSGTIVITDSGNGSPRTIALTGTGTSAALTLSANTLTFATQTVGTTSAAQSVTLTNSGTASLTIASIVAAGDYAQTNNCGSGLAAGSSCAVNVTFTPTAAGVRVGTVTITDNAPGSPHVVNLNGTAVAVGPAISFSTPSLVFGTVVVGITSPSQNVTVSNPGNAALTITSIVASGDFAQSNTCGSGLAAGTNCIISVTFTPTTTGTRAGAITVTDDAGGSPHAISLTGTGAPAGPAVSLSKSSVAFVSQPVGTTSAAQVVTLANSGNATLTITSIVASGDFAQTNNCGASVAAAANCTINVTFGPTATGLRNGALTITDNAPGSPRIVALSGTGTDISINVPAGSQTSATVSPGQSATFTITIAPSGGFNDNLLMSCTGAPPAGTCSVSPGSILLNSATSATVTVTTSAASSAQAPRVPPLSMPRDLPPLWIWLLALGMMAAMASLTNLRRRRVPLAFGATLVLVAILSGCASGQSVPEPIGRSAGTPPGTYSVVVTARTASGFSRNITLTVIVR